MKLRLIKNKLVLLVGLALLGQGNLDAQKKKEVVQVKIKQTTLQAKMGDVYCKMVADNSPVYKLNVYYTTQPRDSFCCFKGYLYNFQLIGPSIRYSKEHSVMSSNNYVIISGESQYSTDHRIKKGTQVEGYDTASGELIITAIPSDTFYIYGYEDFNREIGFKGIENGLSVENLTIGKEVSNYGFGYREGTQRMYDLKGNLVREISYRRDWAEGPENDYYPCNDTSPGCGKLWFSSFYKGGMKNGDWKYYSPTGKLSKTEHYEDNELQGEVTTYYENGKIDSMYNYRDGQLMGICGIWSPEGVMLERTHYMYGNLFGKYNSWYANGSKKEEGEYDRGRKIKLWRTWDERGILTSYKIYKPEPLISYLNGIDMSPQDGVFSPDNAIVFNMTLLTYSKNDIEELYSNWIYTKAGKPLLKFDEDVVFKLNIDENGGLSWSVISVLNKKQMQSLDGFFHSIVSKGKATNINGINFASETTYDLRLVRIRKMPPFK